MCDWNPETETYEPCGNEPEEPAGEVLVDQMADADAGAYDEDGADTYSAVIADAVWGPAPVIHEDEDTLKAKEAFREKLRYWREERSPSIHRQNIRAVPRGG